MKKVEEDDDDDDDRRSRVEPRLAGGVARSIGLLRHSRKRLQVFVRDEAE